MKHQVATTKKLGKYPPQVNPPQQWNWMNKYQRGPIITYKLTLSPNGNLILDLLISLPLFYIPSNFHSFIHIILLQEVSQIILTVCQESQIWLVTHSWVQLSQLFHLFFLPQNQDFQHQFQFLVLLLPMLLLDSPWLLIGCLVSLDLPILMVQLQGMYGFIFHFFTFFFWFNSWIDLLALIFEWY